MVQEVTQCQQGCIFFPDGVHHFVPDLVFPVQMNQ